MTFSCSTTAQSSLGRPARPANLYFNSTRRLARSRNRSALQGRGLAFTGPSADGTNLSPNPEAASAQAASDKTQQKLQSIQHALQKQQSEPAYSTFSLQRAKLLAETAMLAAVSGLAYTLATLLKLDSYLGYFLPLPVIIAAMRSGPAAARKTVTATCFLLLLLLGPLTGLTYLLIHGSLAWCLGTLWRLRAHWSITVIAGSMTRLLGQLGYLGVTSWTLNENLFNLLLQSVFSMLDFITGGVGTPSPTAVICFLLLLFIVNSTLYICVMHFVYIPVLRSMGYHPTRLPQFVQRLIARRQSQVAI